MLDAKKPDRPENGQARNRSRRPSAPACTAEATAAARGRRTPNLTDLIVLVALRGSPERRVLNSPSLAVLKVLCLLTANHSPPRCTRPTSWPKLSFTSLKLLIESRHKLANVAYASAAISLIRLSPDLVGFLGVSEATLPHFISCARP